MRNNNVFSRYVGGSSSLERFKKNIFIHIIKYYYVCLYCSDRNDNNNDELHSRYGLEFLPNKPVTNDKLDKLNVYILFYVLYVNFKNVIYGYTPCVLCTVYDDLLSIRINLHKNKH